MKPEELGRPTPGLMVPLAGALHQPTLFDEAAEVLLVKTNAGEGMRGLRLGSLRLDLDTFEVQRVRLREVMFGLD